MSESFTDYRGLVEGDNRVLGESAGVFADVMEHHGWFPRRPDIATRTIRLAGGSLVSGIALGIFSDEAPVTSYAVTTEAIAYRGFDSFIYVQLHRAIHLPSRTSGERLDTDDLLSLRMTYKPKDLVQEPDLSHPEIVELIQTFLPAKDGDIRDLLRVVYTPATSRGNAKIRLAGGGLQSGFNYWWQDSSLHITEGGKWIARVPRARVYAYVDEKSVFRLMDAVNDTVIEATGDQQRFQATVNKILNPTL